jgi:hypothetical protein
MKSRSKLSIIVTTWIENARKRNPYDKDLVDDLWRIRDILDEVGEHRHLKDRLISRVEGFKKTAKESETLITINDILVILREHYGKDI